MSNKKEKRTPGETRDMRDINLDEMTNVKEGELDDIDSEDIETLNESVIANTYSRSFINMVGDDRDDK